MKAMKNLPDAKYKIRVIINPIDYYMYYVAKAECDLARLFQCASNFDFAIVHSLDFKVNNAGRIIAGNLYVCTTRPITLDPNTFITNIDKIMVRNGFMPYMYTVRIYDGSGEIQHFEKILYNNPDIIEIDTCSFSNMPNEEFIPF